MVNIKKTSKINLIKNCFFHLNMSGFFQNHSNGPKITFKENNFSGLCNIYHPKKQLNLKKAFREYLIDLG